VRAEMFAHHHIHREPLSVRARMSDVLVALQAGGFVGFSSLFNPEEGRMGVAVTFVAVLELMREGLIEISQTEPYGPIHVRGAEAVREGRVIDGESAAAQAEDSRLLEQIIDEGADDEEPAE